MEDGQFIGSVSRSLRRLSRINAVVVMGVGLTVFIAWLLDYDPLKSLVSGLPTMKANTALCFALSGAVLLMAGIERPSSALRRFAAACAALVMAVGALTLVEYFLGMGLGLDNLLVTDRAYDVELGYPGRMSPNTALCFMALSAALLCVELKTRVMGWPSQYLAALVGIFALMGVGSYLYGQREFTGITRYTQMAVHTTGCFLLLAFGVFLVQAERGFMQVISSPGPGGVLARRLLPPALAFPLLLGGLGLWAYHAGALPLPFAQSLIAVGNILLFTVLVWGTAFALDRVEVDRRRIDEERMGLATRERAAREEAAAQQRERSRAEAEQGRLAVLSRRLAEREQLLRLMVESADLSTWSMDCRTRLITADARFLDFQGLDPSGPVPLSAVLERIHPGDRTGTERAIEAALAGESGGRLLAESRVLGPSGAYRWGEMRAQVTFTPEGTPLTIQGVSFDVTGRKEAEALREEALQRIRTESERQRLMFELAPASIAVLEGPEHRFRVANANYRQLVGGREVLGRPLAEALPETVEQGFIALLDTVRRTGEPHVGREVWLQVAQGPGTPPRSVCLDFVYQPLLDAAGRVDAIFVHAVEFTALVRAREVAQQAVRDLESLAERMRRGEARLALALAVSGTGLWELDLEKMRYTADTRFREMLGLAHDELLTLERGLTFLHPEDRARVADSLGAALAGDNGGAYAEEYRTVRREDGSYRWVSARGQASFGADGKAVHFAGTGLDVTERKNAELAQTWLLRSIADQDVFGVAVLEGPELRFTLANAGYRAFVGGRDVLGKPFLEAIPEAHGQGVDVLLLNVIRTKRAITQAETRLLVDARGQGVPEPRDYTFTWQPILEADGSVRSVLILGMDITEGVRMRERAEALAQLERQRAEFAQQLIGIVSHDLRSPLSAIRLGAATLQRRTGLDAGASRTVQRIQTSTDRAERMVRELLDFTQVRLGGGLKIERQPADLHELIRGVVQEVEEAQPGVRIHHEARGEGRGTWDEDRLQQVVQNLVTNALKYGAPGEVVSVFTEGHEDTVTLGVHNQGEPITPERQASLFQPMQRGVEGVDRQGRSVGLGLFIVRAIVEAHGGTVQLTSRAGEGTTFRILLPRGAPPEA